MATQDIPGSVPPSINCYQCSTLIDLGDQTAFTHVDCPQCGALSLVPLQFGNFLLLSPLGVGGVGTVYKAVDLSLNRNLALKILRPKMAAKPEFIESFSREARAAAAVSHPNIAQVYSFGEHQGQYYLAMELLERGSLDDRITTMGKLAEKDVLEFGRQVAAGLRAAEHRGLLHRDIKPGNILFNDDNMPKIVDFGLARATDQSKAENEPIWGTPYYIAPEKLRGQGEDLRSDIYSLGATLYHALAGRPPFDAETASEVVSKHTTQPALSLRTYAPELQQPSIDVIGRMLSKNPADRYQSYEELIHAFEGALDHYRDAHAKRTVVSSSGERIPLRSVIATLVGLVVAIGIILFVWVSRNTIFKLETEPIAAPTSSAGDDMNEVTAEPVATEPQLLQPYGMAVDFLEDAEWVAEWNTAIAELGQGRYQEAFKAFNDAKSRAGSQRPQVRQWIHFLEGLTLLAAERPQMSMNLLAQALSPHSQPRIVDPITTGNFVDPLIYLLLGELPVSQFEQRLRRMPPWAAALTQVCIGFYHLHSGQFQQSVDALRLYIRTPRAVPENEWVHSLQPVAERMVDQLMKAFAVVDQANRLVSSGQADKAEALYAAHLKTCSRTIQPLLQQQHDALAPALKALAAKRANERRLAEQRRLQAEAEAKARVQAEAELVATMTPKVAPLLARYDFDQARQQYQAFDRRLTTAAAHQVTRKRIADMTLLVELKEQLIQDIARDPLPADSVTTRSGTRLPGRVQRASKTELYSATPYGEMVSRWADLPPSELMKMGDYYARHPAAKETNQQHGQRYLRLAVFAREYGFDDKVREAAREAIRLLPGQADQIRDQFGLQP